MSLRLGLIVAAIVLLLGSVTSCSLTQNALKAEKAKSAQLQADLTSARNAAKIAREASEDLTKRLVKVEATSAADRKALAEALAKNPGWGNGGIPKEVLDALK